MKKTRRTKKNQKRILSSLVSFLLILAMVGSLTGTAMASQPEETDAEEQTADTQAADTDAVEETAAVTDMGEAEDGQPENAAADDASEAAYESGTDSEDPSAGDIALLDAGEDENPADDADAEEEAFAVYSATDTSLTFYYDVMPEEGAEYHDKEATGVYPDVDVAIYTSRSMVPWADYTSDITNVTIDESFAAVQPLYLRYWFSGFENCTSFDLKYLDTSEALSTYDMFYACHSATQIDVSGFDMGNVQDMRFMFQECTKVETLDVSKWNTSNVVLAGYVFDDCESVKELDVSGWNMSNCTDMAWMFCFCQEVTELDVSQWNTSSATDMEGMFDACLGITSLDLSGWDVSNVTQTDEMFNNCPLLTTLDLSTWNLSSVTTTKDMFSYCSGLTVVQVPQIASGSLTDMSGMFRDCYALESLDLSGWNTSNVTNMRGLFYQDSALESLTLTDWDTGNVTDMSFLFYDCESLPALDVTGFDTKNATDMSSMFSHCYGLTSINVTNFDTSSATDMTNMFRSCTGLTGLDLYSFDTTKVEACENFLMDCEALQWIRISEKFDLFKKSETALVSEQYWYEQGTNDQVSNNFLIGFSGDGTYEVHDADFSIFAVYSEDDYSLTFYEDTVDGRPNKGETYKDKTVTDVFIGFESLRYTAGLVPWHDYREDIKSVVVDESFAKVEPVSAAYWFYDFANCTSFDLEHLDTSRETDMSDMFYGCASVTSLDLNGFDTDQVTDMSYMFCNCSALEELDISGFETEHVTDMSYMFCNCNALATLTFDTEKFNTGSVTNMASMFDNCKALYPLDVSGFDTSNVTNMAYMFYYCQGRDADSGDPLVLDVGNWDTSNVTLTIHMFDHVTYIEELDLSSWDTSKVTSMQYMFRSCTHLPTITFGEEFDTSNVTDMMYMFYGCTGLTTLDVSGWDVSKVTTFVYTFYDCSSLTSLDLHTWNPSSVTNIAQTFHGCKSMTSLDVSGWDTSNVTTIQGMLYGCNALESIDLSTWDTSKVTTMNTLFRDCTSLTEIDVSTFDMSKCENIGQMFQGCTGLTEIDLSSFNTESLTTMANVFNGCTNLETINLRGWKTDKATGMASEFADCTNLQTIFVDEGDFDTSHYSNDTNMFHNDVSILGQNGTTYDEDNYQHEMARIDTAENPGYLTDIAMFAVYCEDDHSLTFYGDKSFPEVGEDYNGKTVTALYKGAVNTLDEDPPWEDIKTEVETVSCDESIADLQPKSFYKWFSGMTNCTSVDLTYLDTTTATVYTDMMTNMDSLVSLTIGDKFDLFTQSEDALVSQQDWYAADGAQESDDYMIGIDTAGTYYTDPCAVSHHYGAPVFDWSEDYTSCKAIFTCEYCGDVQEVDCEVTKTVIDPTPAADGEIIYTATCEFEDVEYEDVQTLEGEPSMVEISGMKLWEDAGNQDGLRPSDITVYLYADGDVVDSVTVTAGSDSGDEWNWAFDDQRKFKDGEEIDYTIGEADVTGYDSVVTGDVENGFAITNSYTPEQTDVSGTITWKDGNDQDGKRPGFVTAQLVAQDENGGTLDSWDFEVAAPADPEYDGGGNEIWSWTRNDLDKYYGGGKEIKYTVIYTGVDLDVYEQDNPNDLDTIYSYTPETTTISGNKTWVDDDDADHLRPESITVRLHASGSGEVYEQTVTETDGWSWTFTDLPVYANGQHITYTLTEDAVENYYPSYDGWDITNTLEAGSTSVTVMKDWEDADDQDGKRPESVTVELLANGTSTGKTVTLSEENNWEDDFRGLDIYEEGVRINYTVEEQAIDVEGYETEIAGDASIGFTITNSYTPELLNDDGTLTGTKVWEDADDQDGIRPSSIYVHLLADGTAVKDAEVRADANGEWAFAFEDLDKYANGTEIEYTVEEVLGEAAAAEYTASYSGDMANGFTIMNTHTPELLNGDGTLTVTKVWDDADDQDGLRPAGVTVHLWADDEEVDSAILGSEAEKTGLWQSVKALFTGTRTLAAEDEWMTTFTDLPKYRDGGEEIVYTITEDGVDGYETAVSGDTVKGFTVTNTHTPATITLSGQKVWDDAEDQDGKRPTSITINLLADGDPALDERGNAITETVVGENEDDWVWSFADLPQYRDGGTEIDYTMEEDTTALSDIYTTTTEGSMADGFTITNSYKPELYNGDGTFKVVLVWDDEANNDGIRPTEVNIKLTKNQTTVEGAEMTLTADETDADGNWIGTFTDLPKYENGSEITYSVKEDVKSGYTYRVELKTDSAGNTYVQLTNVHVSVKENIDVTKIWDDADDQDGQRPKSITVRLLTNGNLYKEKELTADTEGVTVSADGNVWQYTMTDIPVDKNGEAIAYTMLEVDVDNYGTPEIETIRGDEITDDGVTYQPYSFVVTNSHTPAKIDITGEKVWDDANDQDGKRPQYVTVRLYANDVEIASTDVTAPDEESGAENSWPFTFTDLDKYADGKEITYTIEADAVEDYDTTITGDAADGFTVTSSYTPETTSISGSKTWVDDDNAANTRPASITVCLHANGTVVDEKTVNAANDWSWEFDDLPVYQDGHQITYLVTEDEVDDYDTVYTFDEDGSYNVTNTLDSGETSVTVIKDWEDEEDQDGKRPESISVALMRDGAVAKDHNGEDAVITLTEDGHWIGSFTQIDEYDGSGVKIEYTVQEVSVGVDGYESEITGDMTHGFVITNSYTPETIALSGSKVWKDADDQDGIRPDSVTIHLLADGETVESKSVTAADNWEWTFEGLDKYAAGTEIAYTMEEAYVADGYEAAPGDASNDYTFTNTHEPEKIDISGTKTWDDDNDRDGIRPESVEVSLYANGEPALDASGDPIRTTVEPDADGSWNYTFTDLDKYANGEEINYSIVEDVPGGYTAAYTYSGYDVTNNHAPELVNGDGKLDVIMHWNDESDQDGLRPKRTTITLTVNGVPDETITLVLSDDSVDEYGNWIGTFTDLYKYEEGEEIAYNVEEGVMNGYTYTAELVYDEDAGRYYVEITNTHAAVTSDITVTKVWDDNDDQDGIRPDKVVVNLFSNGSAVKSVTLTPGKEGVEVSDNGNAWSYTFENMPVDQNGEPIIYTLDEVDVGSYAHQIETTTVEGNEKDGVFYTKYDFTVTNSHNPEMTEVSGEKIWDDADDQDGLRPHSITIELLADDVPALDENGEEITQLVTPHADGSWTWTFTDIPKYREGGTEIDYSFEEFAVEGYETSYSEDGRTITNTHEPETTTISGNKVWEDENDRDSKRPDSITVNLYANGLVADTKTVTEEDDWAWTFADVPVYANGQKITYVTTEVAIEDYVTNYSGFTLTNSYEPEKTSVTVIADWEDADDQDGLRPTEITVPLLADGVQTEQTLTLSEDENGIWEGTFTGLNVYSEGTRITYTIGEVSVDGYECVLEGDASEGFSLTFTHTPETIDLSGSKTWDDADDQDGLRPDEITIHLLADGEEILTENVTPVAAGPLRKLASIVTFGLVSAEDDWSFEFTDLPKYENGQEITYTISEAAVTGYDTAITGDAESGFAITNTHTPETITVSGTKVWQDANDQDGLRPANIAINLLADGKAAQSLTVTDTDGDWGWEFTGLPKYASGEAIEYTVTEDAVEEYDTAIVGDAASGFTVINSHTPEEVTISGSKTWDDADNQDGNRPGSVTIRLHANGEVIAARTVTAYDSWTWTFSNQPKYENGVEIAYAITEDAIDEYNTAVDGYDVTNSYTPGKTSLTVLKDWEDADDQDGLRPKEITVELLADGTATGETLTLSEANGWEDTFTDLDEYAGGSRIEYTVTEAAVDGYESALTGDATEGFVFINTHEPETNDIFGSKVWNDGENQDGIRPESITVHLFADGSPVKSATVSGTEGENLWSWAFADMPKYKDGQEIEYTVTEDEVAGYTGEVTGDLTNGYEIANTHEPETVSVSGSKTWDDANDQDGKRPASITIRLHANGEVIDTKTVTADDDWAWTFADLPKYASGHAIAYTVTEDALDDYSTTVSGYDITNHYTPGQTSVTVLKKWEDNDDQDGKRPDSVTVELLADGTATGQTLTLSEANGWEDTFTELNEYVSGSRIEYTVTEAAVDGYESELTGDATEGFLFTNTHEPETSDIFGSKVWDDEENQDGIRPGTITVHLFADGDPVKDTTVSGTRGENLWTWTFADMPKYKDGQEIEYTVTEDEVAGYSSALTGDLTNGYEFTNTHEPEMVSVTGSKTWDDANDQDGKRPASITIRLHANGEVIDTKTVTADDDWSWTFTDLPANAGGHAIAYTVTEDALDDYSTTVSGYDVMNSYTPEQTSVTVIKDWEDAEDQDGVRPDSVTVELLANGTATGETLTLSEANGWEDSFTGLDEYENGTKIAYAVAEVDVAGYTSEITGDAVEGYVITNTHETETTTVTGSKTWDDANDQDGKRPASITIRLHANGEVIDTKTVTADDDWSWAFTDLPANAGGQAITYTVTEDALDDYSTTMSGYNATNSYTPGETSVTVIKDWEDNDDQDGVRPHSVTVELLANGTATGETLTLSAGNGWENSFTGLDEYKSGRKIAYTVAEVDVEGYTSEITGDAVTGYVITNTHETETTTVTGSKTWDDANDQDGKRPESITIRLHANGEVVDTKTVTADDDWSWSFTDLPKYASGHAIAYTVTEDALDDYSTTVSGYDITNHYTPEQTSVTVIKDWEDAEDQDGVRPGSVTVELLANGAATGETLTLSEANGWEDTFTELEEYESGAKIEYTVSETAVEDYTSEITGDAVTGYVITNTHEPEKITDAYGILWISIVWDDNDNQDGLRPLSITIRLTADGEEIEGAVLVLSEENNWEGAFEGLDLDKYEHGVEVVYSVEEFGLDESEYTHQAVLKYDEATGHYYLEVTNTHTPEPVPVVDKEVLEAAIGDADALNASDYTEDSWNALQTALEAAKAVDEDENATQTDVNNAAIDLIVAIAELEFAESQPGGEVDKADLLDEYVDSINLTESDYTPESWEALENALAAAQEVLLDPEATQDAVDDALLALKTAKDNLEPAGEPRNGLYRIVTGELWGYYVDDEVDTSYTGFASNENGDWYVENGYVNFSKSSVYKDVDGKIGDKGTWYYVVRNAVQHDFTGLANYRNENGWWYINQGAVDFTHNGVDKNKNGWWYVTGGKVQFNFTGLANYKNENGWWYISGGKVNFNANTVAKNKNGWWYVTGGKVQFGFTGLANYRNANGWWYINAGKVTFDYTGVASNQNGTWYIVNSKVDFGYSGTVTDNGKTYTVKSGKVN